MLFSSRLRVERAGGGWCPKLQIEQGVREFLQVDLDEVYVVTGVQTQGRFDHGRGQEYAEEYSLEYWRPGLAEWRAYHRWDGKKVRVPSYIIIFIINLVVHTHLKTPLNSMVYS